ncbi:MAG: PD-(D/E)XK nuclease family protein [Candidatus Gastranaerophilales bacterium]|nr:PD-(D/E)XK nuclease family protein [Candidatus Gastranaerophilales bacterium]
MQELGIISPAMLKLFSDCNAKFYYQYIEQIPLPKLDKSFITGKNIHALASYYLQGHNIEKFEKSLTETEKDYWTYLKSCEYIKNEVVGVEKNISCRIDKYWIGGRIDAIVKSENDYYILDYKTGGIKNDMTYDYQTMVYLLLCHNFYQDYNNLYFVYLDLKNKKEQKIKFTEELKQEYENKLIQVCSKMSEFELKTFIPSDECSCEYSKICKQPF